MNKDTRIPETYPTDSLERYIQESNNKIVNELKNLKSASDEPIVSTPAIVEVIAWAILSPIVYGVLNLIF